MRKLLIALTACSALTVGTAAVASPRTNHTQLVGTTIHTNTVTSNSVTPNVTPTSGTSYITPSSPGTATFNVSGDPFTGTDPVSAYIGDTIAMGSPSSPYTFTDIYNFVIGPTGGNFIGVGSGSVTTSASVLFSATDLDFTQVLVNGINVPLTSQFGGLLEGAGTVDVPIYSGVLNTISITGISRGNGSYGGTISFQPMTPSVPEPATWALMLIGFGGIGFSMRRRRASARLLQAA